MIHFIKKSIGFIAAGMTGALMVVFILNLFPSNDADSSKKDAATMKAFHTADLTESVNFDFALAAEKATNSVVHIQASESELKATQRYNMERKRLRGMNGNPWGDIFNGNPMFNPFLYEVPLYQKKGSGSGIIISDNGYIVTNNHVVEFADQLEVTLTDGRKFSAEVIGTEPNTDLAVIKIEADNLNAIKYANSDDAKVGEWVLAIGNPFDYLTSTVTAGIISAKGRDLDIIKGDRAVEQFIQTDAVINPGNSGGALVDINGDLLGVNTAIASRTGVYNGYSFAIPVNLMAKITNDIIKYGSYQHANLGIYISAIDQEYMDDLDLSSNEGVIIVELIPGGVAQFAGLLPNDVIVQINDDEIKNVKDLQESMSLARVGDKMSIEIIRNGRLKTVDLVLKKGI